MVREYLPSESYYLLHTATMVGLFTCVFAKTCQSESVRDVQSADVKCGMAGLYGNKVRGIALSRKLRLGSNVEVDRAPSWSDSLSTTARSVS